MRLLKGSTRNYESIICKLRRRSPARKNNRGLRRRDENVGDEGLPWATYTRARRRSRANKSRVLILFAPLSCDGIIITDRRGLSFIWPLLPLSERSPVSLAVLLRFTVHGIRPARSPNQFRLRAAFPTRSTLRAFSLSRHLNKSYKYDCAPVRHLSRTGDQRATEGLRDSRGTRRGLYIRRFNLICKRM